MKIATRAVRAARDAMTFFVQAWKCGKAESSARIVFDMPELLWQVRTAERWALLKTLCSAGPISIREAVRRVGLDVKAVHVEFTLHAA